MRTARPRPRPSFELVSTLPAEELTRRVRAFLQQSRRLRGVVQPDRVTLSWAEEEQRFWSPHLQADLTPEGEGTRVSGKFGPDPYLWATYVLGSLGLAVLTCVALAFGVAQLIMHTTPTGLFASPAGAVLAGLAYGASYVGQGLGSEQMYLMRATMAELAEVHDHEPEA
jgi:hypothetical protein